MLATRQRQRIWERKKPKKTPKVAGIRGQHVAVVGPGPSPDASALGPDRRGVATVVEAKLSSSESYLALLPADR